MSKAPNRPYFQSSIADLEELADGSTGDVVILLALEVELGFRTTDRGRKLKARIGARIASLSKKGVSDPSPDVRQSPHIIRSSSQAMRPATKPRPPSASAGSKPGGAEAVLSAWTALEALTPQTYRRPEDLASGDRSCVVNLGRGALPWVRGETSRPNRQLYYQVILGAIPMDRATNDLVHAFGANEEHGSRAREKAAIAAVMVDRRGVLVDENGISVSSFAWALPLALQMRLNELGSWPALERGVLEKLDGLLRRSDADGKPLPLNLASINAAHDWIVGHFGLPRHLVEEPTFATRVFHYFRAKAPPESPLLNSFYLGDLARAARCCRAGDAPRGMRQYLGLDSPSATLDLFTDMAALEEAVAPGRMPAACWPSPGGHPLVLLQQAAVNIAHAELRREDGIIAVNGPPGTGKTTLLRDVVAASVLDRAIAMTEFEDPADAFKASGEKLGFGGSAFFHLYRLDPTLRGHEVLVASSNNKAVENVSRELPSMAAIGRGKDLAYFRSVAAQLHATADLARDGSGPVEDSSGQGSWGLIAAVLGNAKNRATFQQNFWWNDEYGFRLYLKAAKGDSVVREIRDESGTIIERRIPAIIAAERPPSPQEAQRNWPKARERLLALKREVNDDLLRLERLRVRCVELSATRRKVVSLETVLAKVTEQRPQKLSLLAERQTAHSEAKCRVDETRAVLTAHSGDRPGWLSRLFRSGRWRMWSSELRPLRDAVERAETLHRAAHDALQSASSDLNALDSQIEQAEKALAEPRAKVAKLASIVESHRKEIGDGIIDEAFFKQSHGEIHLASPWIPAILHRKREDLFVAAMDAHRAFIDGAAQKVLHNLSVLMEVLGNGDPTDPAKRALLGDLWSTLFLVIPVLSTTFASVDRMLSGLPPGSIGWLLIDEAGQALPQAALGAVMRSRRSIIVGDPLQIDPVVTLPQKLITEICTFYRIEERKWVAPKASAQTVADRASHFQAAFRSDQGHRRVGIPLLVHRRCQDPMFGISNRIAYDGQMVHAPPRAQSAIGDALGPSRWFDIDGTAESKWCPKEGELMVELVKRIADDGLRDPDLFIITPFRIVAQELRRRLERETDLFSALGVDVREWTHNRVGTTHTVQGREAEAVILVLGAPMDSQSGARHWAGGTPNLLNVAVSRAKQRLYVIGSYAAWSGAGHARELATMQRERC